MDEIEKKKIENALSNLESTENKISFVHNLLKNNPKKEFQNFLNDKLEYFYIKHYKENYKNPQMAVDFYAGLGKKEAEKIAGMFNRYKDPSMASYILKKIGNYSGARKIWTELNQPFMVVRMYEEQAEAEKNKYKRKKYFLKAAEIWKEFGESEKAKENYRRAGFIEFLKSRFK